MSRLSLLVVVYCYCLLFVVFLRDDEAERNSSRVFTTETARKYHYSLYIYICKCGSRSQCGGGGGGSRMGDVNSMSLFDVSVT